MVFLKKILKFIFLFFLTWNPSGVHSNDTINISKLRISSIQGDVRIIIDADRKPNYEVFSLKNPNRLVIDLAKAKFAENFSFGSNIILKDISKLCSLDNKIIENIISNNCIDDISFNTHKYVDKKYFEDSAFRKISLEHISEIARYRIE